MSHPSWMTSKQVGVTAWRENGKAKGRQIQSPYDEGRVLLLNYFLLHGRSFLHTRTRTLAMIKVDVDRKTQDDS